MVPLARALAREDLRLVLLLPPGLRLLFLLPPELLAAVGAEDWRRCRL